MANPSTDQAIQHVYVPRGETERALACAPRDPALVRVATIADLVPVTDIMSREVACASPSLDVDTLAELMVRNHFGCLPVVNERGEPIGMVTKLDLVEQLLATTAGEQPPRTAELIMMPLAITLADHATVAHAAALMAAEDIHHVPIVDDDGRLIGLLSTMDIVRWLAVNDGFASARQGES